MFVHAQVNACGGMLLHNISEDAESPVSHCDAFFSSLVSSNEDNNDHLEFGVFYIH